MSIIAVVAICLAICLVVSICVYLKLKSDIRKSTLLYKSIFQEYLSLIDTLTESVLSAESTGVDCLREIEQLKKKIAKSQLMTSSVANEPLHDRGDDAKQKNAKKTTDVTQPNDKKQEKDNFLTPYISPKGKLLNNVEIGFNANIRLLKELIKYPIVQNMFYQDSMTIEMFNIDYLQKWQPHRFNSRGTLCNLVIVAKDNLDKYLEYETYESNGKFVAKIPCSQWGLEKFYSMFCAARRVELKDIRAKKVERNNRSIRRLDEKLARVRQLQEAKYNEK